MELRERLISQLFNNNSRKKASNKHNGHIRQLHYFGMEIKLDERSEKVKMYRYDHIHPTSKFTPLYLPFYST